jgi:hypothetical protein
VSSVEAVRRGNISSAELMKASNSCLVIASLRHRTIAQKAWIAPPTGLLKIAKREHHVPLMVMKMSFSPPTAATLPPSLIRYPPPARTVAWKPSPARRHPFKARVHLNQCPS